MKSVSSQNAAPETTGADSVPLPGDVTVPDAFRRRRPLRELMGDAGAPGDGP